LLLEISCILSLDLESNHYYFEHKFHKCQIVESLT